MNTKSKYLLLIFLIGLTLCAGCTRYNKDKINPTDINRNSLTEENDSDLMRIVSLIGKNDEEIVEKVGPGLKNTTSEEGTLLREFAYSIQNNELTAILSYNEKGKVIGAYSYLPNLIEDNWEDILTVELGTPTQIEEPTDKANGDGNYITNVVWNIDGRLLKLYGSDGSLSIQIE